MIGVENSCQFLNQSESKLKPITTWSLAFSRASGNLFVSLWGKILSSYRARWRGLELHVTDKDGLQEAVELKLIQF